MSKGLNRHLTYANVIATLALFVALGGSSYAAIKISGRDIRSHSIGAAQIRKNSLGGGVIKESKLGIVPAAREANRLDGIGVERLLVRCPEGTVAAADTCIETQARPPASLHGAMLECAATDNQSGIGRRLPTYQELAMALTHNEIALAPGGELTSEVSASASTPGEVEAIYVTSKTGGVALTPDNPAGAKSYRCVADPLNR